MQSFESSAHVISKSRKNYAFDNNQSADSQAYTETVTEAQDHAKSPVSAHTDELSRVKKKALIAKT